MLPNIMRSPKTPPAKSLPSLKSPRELALMRRAGIVNWGAHQLITRMVKPGVSTLEIDNAVEKYFAGFGAIPLFKGVPGKTPFPAVCCMSVNDEVVHPAVLQGKPDEQRCGEHPQQGDDNVAAECRHAWKRDTQNREQQKLGDAKTPRSRVFKQRRFADTCHHVAEYSSLRITSSSTPGVQLRGAAPRRPRSELWLRRRTA